MFTAMQFSIKSKSKKKKKKKRNEKQWAVSKREWQRSQFTSKISILSHLLRFIVEKVDKRYTSVNSFFFSLKSV